MATIVFVGDSNTTTAYVPLNSNYAYRVSVAVGQSYVNNAVVGYYTSGIVTNIQSLVLAYNPKNVMVMIGTNDAVAAEAAATSVADAVAAYIGSMRSFISQIRQAGKRLFVLSPPISQSPAVNAYLVPMRDALATLCFEQTTTFLDVMGKMQYYGTLGETFLEDWFIPSAADNYHLSAVGHAYIYDMILKTQM